MGITVLAWAETYVALVTSADLMQLAAAVVHAATSLASSTAQHGKQDLSTPGIQSGSTYNFYSALQCIGLC